VLPRVGTAALLLLALLAPAARAQFPQGPPNDPFYDQAEEQPSEKCIDDEQFELFDFMPACTPNAYDPDGAAGMSVNRVWREFTTGDPEIVIAYVEGGVNWHRREDLEELRNKVYLNARELPPPTTPDADPALRADDYADTHDANGNGAVDPEDIIVRFSDKVDTDRNGYVDDISGWDFYNDQNNPATTDSAYTHANAQMIRAAAETNNGAGKAGVCPRCRLLPVRSGAEALARADDLPQAWLFAADSGARVIASVTADLGYSTLMRRVAEYVHQRGIQAVVASNDFNSSDHQAGMYHPFVLPGNGIVPDLLNTPASRATTTYRERSSITSWGPHSMFVSPSNSGTTSANTPLQAGLVGLLLSVNRSLSGPEVVQVMRTTASEIDDDQLAWPSSPGWDLHFGYGRPHAYRAAQAIAAGAVPPVPAINDPDWFALADPTKREIVPVNGRIDARRSASFTWKLQVGLGAQPSEEDWRTAGGGSGARRFRGRLGIVDLREIPRWFWSRRMELSERKELESTDRYTVTLRLTVTDAEGRTGVDRRAFYVHRDRDQLERFPKRVATGGAEGQPALVDLQGLGRLAIVFGDTDGWVHAIDSESGRELAGFPAWTRRTRLAVPRRGIRSGRDPIVANVAVGDLDGRGRLSIVATTTSGSVYAWNAFGRLRNGFPRRLNRGVDPPSSPRRARPRARAPIQGAFAAPVLGDLDGDGRAEIIQAAWDGRLHVFRRTGKYLRGWPVKVELPASFRRPPGYSLIRDEKLQSPPALADLDGDGRLEIVQRSQYTAVGDEEPAQGVQFGAQGHLHAYRADGTPVPGWPVAMQGVAEAYGSGQEFITEGSNAPAAADVDGDGNDEVVSNPVLSPSYLFDGDGTQRGAYGASPADAGRSFLDGADYERMQSPEPPVDVPVGFTTSGAFGRFGGGLSFAQPGTGGASIAATINNPGLGTPVRNVERAFDAFTLQPRPNFPAAMQGLNFVGAPLVVDVTGDGDAEIVDGGDSNVLHAFTPSGSQADGFPKFTTGWMIWSPAAGDLDGDGTVELAATTREGYLMVWRTRGLAAANTEWWRWHHDEHSSGRYGADTRPPGIIRFPVITGGFVTFTAPGDDWYAGKAAHYRVGDTTIPAGVAGGRSETLRLPRAVRRCITIQAVDEAGNRAFPKRACRRTPPPQTPR
jgi:hypothetical protein